MDSNSFPVSGASAVCVHSFLLHKEKQGQALFDKGHKHFDLPPPSVGSVSLLLGSRAGHRRLWAAAWLALCALEAPK